MLSKNFKSTNQDSCMYNFSLKATIHRTIYSEFYECFSVFSVLSFLFSTLPLLSSIFHNLNYFKLDMKQLSYKNFSMKLPLFFLHLRYLLYSNFCMIGGCLSFCNQRQKYMICVRTKEVFIFLLKASSQSEVYKLSVDILPHSVQYRVDEVVSPLQYLL